MVDNAVRINIEANLDDSKISQQIAAIGRNANVKLNLDTGSFQDIELKPKVDKEALRKEVRDALQGIGIDINANITGNPSSGRSDNSCCEELSRVLDASLGRIEGGLSRIESNLSSIASLASFRNQVSFDPPPQPIQRALEIEQPASATQAVTSGLQDVVTETNEVKKESKESAKLLRTANKILSDIEKKTQGRGILQSAATGFAIGGGQALFRSVQERGIGGTVRGAREFAGEAIQAGREQSFKGIAKQITAPLLEAVKDGLVGLELISPAIGNQLVKQLTIPLTGQVTEGLNLAFDKAAERFKRTASTGEFTVEVLGAEGIEDVSFSLQSINAALQDTGDILEDTDFRIEPSEDSVRLLEGLKNTLEGLRNVDVGLEPERAQFLADNFERIAENLQLITRLQTEGVPSAARTRESAALLRSQQAQVTRTLNTGRREISKRGITADASRSNVPDIDQGRLDAIRADIESQVSDARESAKIIGIEIINGISEGLGQTQELDAPIMALAMEIQEGIKEPLEIASPSRWAERVVGNNIILGITEGLQNGFNQIRDVARQVATNIQNSLEGVKGTGEFVRNALALGPAVLTVAQIGTVATAIGVLAKATIPAALGLANVRRQLIAVGRVNTGQVIQRFTKLSNEVGASVQETLDGFARFATVTRNTILEAGAEDVFADLATGFASAGAGAQEQARAFTAIEQILSKTVVQSEELRGQLAEALPQSLGIAARALGVTERELQKLVQSGEVLAEEFIPLFAQQFARETDLLGGLTFDAPGTNLARLQNQITSVAQSIGQVFVPAFNTGLKVINGGLGALNASLDQLILFGLSAGVAALAPSFVQLGTTLATVTANGIAAAQSLFAYATAANTAGASTARLNPQLLALAQQFAGFAGLTVVVAALFQSFGEGSEEINAARESAVRLNRSLRETKRELEGVASGATGVENVLNPFGRANERRLVETRGIGFLQRVVALFNKEVKDSQNEILKAANLTKALTPNLGAVDDFVTRINEVDLGSFTSQLTELDATASNLRVQLSEASRIGDTEGVERLQGQLSDAIRQSTELRRELQDAVGVDPGVLERNLDILERNFSQILEESPDIFSLEEASRFRQELSSARQELEQGADALNQVLRGSRGRTFDIRVRLQEIERTALNEQFIRDLRAVTQETDILADDLVRSVRDVFSQGIEQNRLSAQLEDLQNQIQELEGIFDLESVLGISDLTNIAEKLGLDSTNLEGLIDRIAEQISPETIANIIESEGDTLDAALRQNLQTVQQIVELRQQQAQTERDILSAQRELQDQLEERQQNLREVAEQGFSEGISAGANIEPLRDAIQRIGDVTANELSNINSGIEAAALRIGRGSAVLGRITAEIDAERARISADAVRQLNRDLFEISGGLASGDIGRGQAQSLQQSARLRSEINSSSREAIALNRQLSEIDQLRGRNLANAEVRTDALNRRRRTEQRIQTQINQLLQQGVAFDDARVQSLQDQLRGSREVTRLLSSGLTIDPGQIDRFVQGIEDQLLELQTKEIDLKLQLDLTTAEAQIEELTTQRELELKIIEAGNTDQQIELLRGRVEAGLSPDGGALDVGRLFDIDALQQEAQVLEREVDAISRNIASAVESGASAASIAVLKAERRELVRELDEANREVLQKVAEFQQGLRDTVQGFASSFGDALKENIRATGELRIARLEREGASPNEVFKERLDFLQQEKQVELELLRLDQQRQLIAAQQLQTETKIAALKALETAEEEIGRFQRDPQGIGNRRAAENALQRLALTEQQAALADSGVSQLLKVIGLQEDTLRKGFQNQQEAIIQQGKEAGARNLQQRQLGSAGIADTVNQDIRSSLRNLTDQRSDLVKGFAEQQGVDVERNLILEGIRDGQQKTTQSLSNTITSGLQGVSAAVRGEREGAGQVRPGNIIEEARQGIRSLFNRERGATPTFGRIGFGVTNAPGLGVTTAAGLGTNRFGTGAGLQSLVQGNAEVTSRLDRIASNQETSQTTPISVGDININLELVEPGTPELGENIAESVISRIADIATQSALR